MESLTFCLLGEEPCEWPFLRGWTNRRVEALITLRIKLPQDQENAEVRQTFLQRTLHDHKREYMEICHVRMETRQQF
jgi:hypothetical protein